MELVGSAITLRSSGPRFDIGIGIQKDLFVVELRREKKNPTPFAKFGWVGVGAEPGRGADSAAAATPRTHAGIRAPQLPCPLGSET
jgi:hypothetical protein